MKKILAFIRRILDNVWKSPPTTDGGVAFEMLDAMRKDPWK